MISIKTRTSPLFFHAVTAKPGAPPARARPSMSPHHASGDVDRSSASTVKRRWSKDAASAETLQADQRVGIRLLYVVSVARQCCNTLSPPAA